jgi:8-amino-7-oxononanoate synthase
MGFKLGTETPDSAIIAVILDDQEQAVAMWQALLDGGLYVNMARPPATPAGTYLLRCSLCAEHTVEQIEAVLAMFRAAGTALGVIT